MRGAAAVPARVGTRDTRPNKRPLPRLAVSDARRGLAAAVVAVEQPAVADHRPTQNRGRPRV